MRKMKILGYAAVAMLAACAPKGGDGSDGSGRSVAVGTPVQAAIVAEVAGPSVEVVTLLRSEANPETYEPSVADMRRLHSADLFLALPALPFEERLVQRLEDSDDGVKVCDVSQGIELIYDTHGHGGGEAHRMADPHLWGSPANIAIIAGNVAEALAQAYPDSAASFRSRAAAVKASADSLSAAVRSKLGTEGAASAEGTASAKEAESADKAGSAKGTSFVVWHPSLSYFAREFGVEQIALGEDNKELSAGQLAERLRRASLSGARVLFVQQGIDPRQAATAAAQLGLPVIPVNPLDADWRGQISTVADAITDHQN